ncbi:hypothetical protein IWGMT90018_24920 [Mycobacterium kiyosense]|nr:hypothetical protein IWGMT90018_24920 [Mycobacterium kiyosense]
MSESDAKLGSDTDTGTHSGDKEPDDAALAEMSTQELLDLGSKMDGVEIVYKEPRWPVPGTKAEKRAARSVATWLLLGGGFGLALLLVFLFWPWEYKPKGADGSLLYSLATPLYGFTFGMSVLSIAIGAVLFQKRFIPEEITIQDRHDGASREIDRKTVVANLTDAYEGSTIGRRKLIGASFGLGLGAFGLGTLVAFAGGLIKNPWKPVVPTAEGMQATLWTSGWTPRFKGETIYLARATGAHDGPPYVKMRPEDMDAGGMETVFPWRESDGDGTTVESHEKLSAISLGIRNPVMLIRIKPSDMDRVVKRKGQESFNWGEFFAFTKVCSHLGCPLVAVRAAVLPNLVPLPPVAVRRAALRQADLRSGGPCAGAAADHNRQERVSRCQRQLHRARRSGILGAHHNMSPKLSPPEDR